MENEPTFNDYVSLIYRSDAFVQASAMAGKMGHPYVYGQQGLTVFLMWMQFKRIYQFKTQWRWLQAHPKALSILRWESMPHRTTLSRRYKSLYSLLQELVKTCIALAVLSLQFAMITNLAVAFSFDFNHPRDFRMIYAHPSISVWKRSNSKC